MDERYGGRRIRAEAERRLEEELRVIRHLGLSGFFILHRDLLELAREVAVDVRGPESARRLLPPGRGRGSSVSSIVCYLTGLSHVDPVENELFLGRFLNEELTALPDIDLDFPRDVRDVLIPRVHDRYGRDRCALVAAFATFQVRSAVRDFAKALGLPPGEIERLARAVDPWKPRNDIEGDVPRSGSPRWRALVRLARDAWSLPRHQSQHPGGMVISTQPLIDLCPVQPASMEGRQMVQWDKDSCGDAGFLKIDLLGLGMLSAVERCVDEIARVRGERIDLSRISYDDREVYSQIQAAETMGVFQIESRAQMQSLVRTRPENLDDLTVQVALVRPGPIQGGAVHPYIERRKRLREDPAFQVPYLHPSLEPVLRDTLGAIVFQDQVLEVAMAFAGFRAGEAEGLRRAMSRRRSEAAIRAYEEKFVAGAMANGATREVAEKVWSQIVGFSGFGFPKAHSAAFGLLAYQSTWLRVHYGPEFLCALLNEQPMGFYPPDTLVHEAQRRGMAVLPPCVVRERRRVPGGAPAAPGSPFGSASATSTGSGSRRCGPWSRSGSGAGGGARSGTWRGARARSARRSGGSPGRGPATSCSTVRRVAAPAGAVGAGGGGAGHAGARGHPAGAAARAPRGARAALAVGLGADAGRLRLHRRDAAGAPAGADAPGPARRPAHEQGARAPPARQAGEGGRPGGGPPAPGDGQGRHLHAARGRARHRQPDHPGAGLRALRLAVRAEPLLLATGRLERREGTLNVLVDRIERLERPDLPRAEVKHIEPRRSWSTETQEEADLRAVVPAANSSDADAADGLTLA